MCNTPAIDSKSSLALGHNHIKTIFKITPVARK